MCTCSSSEIYFSFVSITQACILLPGKEEWFCLMRTESESANENFASRYIFEKNRVETPKTRFLLFYFAILKIYSDIYFRKFIEVKYNICFILSLFEVSSTSGSCAMNFQKWQKTCFLGVFQHHFLKILLGFSAQKTTWNRSFFPGNRKEVKICRPVLSITRIDLIHVALSSTLYFSSY